MNPPDDRLYKLLPYYYRTLDEKEHGHALRDLLGVMAEPFTVVENDIAQMYDDWFIETCADWAVPYIGDLAGWQAVESPVPAQSSEAALLRWLTPRRDVANTLRYRRRKGTLPLLVELARDVAGWPALAMEEGFREWLVESHRHRGAAVAPLPGLPPFADVHDPLALQWSGSPRAAFAHFNDVHRGAPALNLPSVALHVWRLMAFAVTSTRARRISRSVPDDYHFSVLGNDAVLFTTPQGAGGLPVHALTRLEIAERVPEEECGCRRDDDEKDADAPPLRAADEYYGPGKAFAIFAPHWPERGAPQPVPRERVIPADLSKWEYHPPKGYVAVDPQTGRLSFPKGSHTKDVRVTWHYGFSAPMGGGEYRRPLSQMEPAKIYRLPKGSTLKAGMDLWQAERDKVKHAIIEFECSGLYEDLSDIRVLHDETLQVRAASGVRPVLRISEASDSEEGRGEQTDDLVVELEAGALFVLDGVILTGGAVRVRSLPENPDAPRTSAPPCPAAVVIRHCTLVPGWSLRPDCGAHAPDKDSIVLEKYAGTLAIERSITGSIAVSAAEKSTEPVPISLSDSILDAASCCRPALYDEDCHDPDETAIAFAALTLRRCTVFGKVLTHAMPLAEDSIFHGDVYVARRQPGCVRFCFVDPCARTPRRYECQPETAMRRASGDDAACGCDATDCDAVEAQRRVAPQFVSERYGQAGYAQLHLNTPEEIRCGAHDRSEMGAFHDLFQPQREANLRARLAEYTPAACEAALIFQT